MDQQTKLPKNIDEEQEIDLLDLFGYYLSKLPLLIAAVIIGALIAGLITYFIIPDKYTATSRMYMVSSSTDSVVDLSDLNIGASLSNDYVELMQSRPVIEDVIEKLKLDYTYEDVLGMIGLSVVNNTRIVKISVTNTDPKEAMEIANQMARTSKRLLPIVMDAPSPSIAEEAVLPTQKSSPSLSKNTILGALVLLVVVLGILTIFYMMDDTIKTSEDVEKEFGIMPLTVIPEGVIEGLEKKDDKDAGKKSRRRNKKKYKAANSVEMVKTTVKGGAEFEPPKKRRTDDRVSIEKRPESTTVSQRTTAGQSTVARPTPQRPMGAPNQTRPNDSRPAGTPNQARPNGPRPAGTPNQVRPNGPRPAGAPNQLRPNGQRPAGATGQARPNGPRPAGTSNQTKTAIPRPMEQGTTSQSSVTTQAQITDTDKGAKE